MLQCATKGREEEYKLIMGGGFQILKKSSLQMFDEEGHALNVLKYTHMLYGTIKHVNITFVFTVHL